VIPRVGLHNYDHKAHSEACQSPGGGVMMTQQHFVDEVDINTIVRRFGLQGGLPADIAGGVYGDFTGITDYDSAVEKIAFTRNRFMALPAELRERFDNDPGRLVSFVAEHSEAELEAIFKPPVAPVAPVAPVVPVSG